MGDNFDDQWEDLDEEVIKECIFIETQTLSQVPNANSEISSQIWNLDSQYDVKKSKATFSRQQFPSVSSFYDDNSVREFKNSKKLQSFSTSLNNKVYNSIPFKGGITNSNSVDSNKVINLGKKISYANNTELHNFAIHNNDDHLELDKLKREKKKLEEENLIKQGEVYNLRSELKRKETVLETERIDHCLAVEAAEKRGKEKTANSLQETELKVKALQVEIEKLYGSLAFKNRETEELLARCQQLEQHQNSLNVTLNKKSYETLQPSKRFKRELDDSKSKNSHSNWKSNFSDRFDFNDQKREVKDVQIQTTEENCSTKRFSLPISSKKGHMSIMKRALILTHENHQKARTLSCGEDVKYQLQMEDILPLKLQNNILVSLQDKFVSIKDSSPVYDDYVIKSVCIQLENILSFFKKNKENERNHSRIIEKYIEVVLPLFNILRIMETQEEFVLFDAIKILALHFLFIYQELKINYPCLYSGLESFLSFISCCNTLPLSLCEIIIRSLLHCLEYLGSCTVGQILLIRTFSSLIQIETFKQEICKNGARRSEVNCLLSQVTTIFSTKDNISNSDLMLHLLIFVSLLLQPPNNWLICSCSINLLHLLVKHLHSLTILPFDSEGSTWQLILFGIKVLHKWQLLDINWWDKIAPLPTYTILMGTVYRRCKKLKTSGKLDQYIGELLYDLHETDDS